MSEEAVQAAEAEETKSAVEHVKEPAAEAAAAPAGVEVAAEAPVEPVAAEPVTHDDVSYQAVEKEGNVTAIWEMQGQKHLRTIDPRSVEGKQILALFETAG
jgi:hypothetical protein